MDQKHIVRSAVMRRLEQQKPLFQTTAAVPTCLRVAHVGSVICPKSHFLGFILS